MTPIGESVWPETAPELGARVPRLPPPLYFAGAFAGGMLLRSATVPLPIGGGSTRAVGAVVVAAGVALAAAGVRGVVRHRTTIVPHHAVSALVTSGAYRFSRNPMYTGLAVAYIGGALLTAGWWPLITLPVALLAVRRLVIGPEEQYLTSTFGQQYAAYRVRVRRWL